MSADRPSGEFWGSWLRGRRWVYVGLLVATLAFAGVFAARVEVEQNNESMNSFSKEELALHAEFRRTFGDDEDLVVSFEHPDLLGAESLALMDEIVARMEKVDGVRRVYSLGNAIELVPGPDGAEERPLIARPLEPGPDAAARNRAAVDRNPELTGFLVSASGKTAGLLVEIEDRPGDPRFRHAIIDALDTLRDEMAARGARVHFTGVAAQKAEVTRLLERDQGILIPASVVVLGCVLFLFFRTVAGALIPLAVTGATLVLTLGVYGMAGLQLNTMTSLLPPVLMVLCVMHAVHLYDRWLAHATPGGDRAAAAAEIVRYLRFPCTFTSLTTVVGMLSLTLSGTPAVEIFGLFTAIGVVIGLAVSLTLVPVLLVILPEAFHRPVGQRPRVTPLLRLLHTTATTHPGVVLGSAVLLAALAIGGITKIRNNTDLVRFLKTDNPLYIDTLAIDEKLTGTSSFEFELSRVDGAPLTSVDTIERLARFRETLLVHPEITGVQSILDILSVIDRGETGRPGRHWPDDPETLLYTFDLMQAAGDVDLIRRLVDPELRRARIRVQVHSVGSIVAGALEREILDSAASIFGPEHRLAITGSYYQVVRDSNRLVRTQVESFALAVGLILATIGAMFRSLRLMVLALIPNVLPVIYTGGLMGLVGIDLSTGTAMIASVVIGLAVDDTIHYLTRFRREAANGTAVALDLATTHTGRALLISSVVLVVGFWVGALGSFKPTIYFSLFTGIAMISALICDLLVLPAALLLVDRARLLPRATALLLIASLGLVFAGASAGAAQASDIDRSHDEVLEARPITSRGREHGVAAIVRRGPALVVQTRLASKVLKRVVARIREQELESWPESHPQHASALAYLRALDSALDAAEAERTRRIGAGGRSTPGREAPDRRLRLLIEFVVAPDDQFVAIGLPGPGSDGEGDPLDLSGEERLDLPRAYVAGNQALIARDRGLTLPGATDQPGQP